MSESPLPPVARRTEADQAAYAHWLRQNDSLPPDLAQALDDHARNAEPPLVLTGAGLALSGLVAAWCERYRRQQDAAAPLFCHHAGCTRESLDPDHLLQRLLRWIRDCCGLRDPVPASNEARVEVLPNWLARLAAQGGAVIVLDRPDALDDHDASQALAWLPTWLPAGIRLIAAVPAGASAAMLRARGWQLAEVDTGPTHALPGPEALGAAVAPQVADDTAQVLAALWCTRSGLSHDQLAALLQRAAGGGDAAVTAAREAAGDWLYQTGEHYALAGPDVRAAVARGWLAHGSERQALEHRVAELFRDAPAAEALDLRPWLLLRAGAWDEFAALLTAPATLDVMLGVDWRDELVACWQGWGTADDVAAYHGDQAAHWPRDEHHGWLLLRLVSALRELPATPDLEPLLQAARERLAGGSADGGGPAELRAVQGAWLADRERADEAEALLRAAQQDQQRDQGADHAATRATRHRLAMLLEERGDSEAAADLYRRTLTVREATLGPNHPELIPHLVNLGAVLRARNALDDARPLYQRALRLAEQHFGSNHPQTAACLDSLAGVLYGGHDFEQAEAYYRRALAMTEAAFGPVHPATAASAHNLGTVLDAREQFREAEGLFGRALDIRREQLGADHADTASSLHNLAGVLDAMGRTDDAEPLYRQAVATWERVVGSEHPATATSINNLADLLREKGAHQEAETLYRRNLDTWTRLLGAGHPHAVMTRSELAILAADRTPGPEAEALLQAAAEQTAEVMGWDSMQHINTVVRYAALLRDQRRRDEACTLLRQTLSRADDKVSMLSPRIQKLRRHLEVLEQGTDTLH